MTEEQAPKLHDTSHDMTYGSILGKITRFAIPVIVSFLFQQLYTMCDAVIVSRTIGVRAMTAIGTVDWLDYLMLGVILGMTEGFTAVMAQYFGERDSRKLKKAFAMIIWCSLGLAVIIRILARIFLDDAVDALQIPDELHSMSWTYCRIYYLGAWAVIFYNVEASIMRGIGDSRTPLRAIILSTCVNILLDLFFILKLKTGIGGAAAATVISQGISGIYCLFVLLRRDRSIIPSKADFEPDWGMIGHVIALSLPIVFENIVITMGGLIVQVVADGFGSVFLAGYSATNKMYDLIAIFCNAFGAAIATFVGQNYGAEEYGRVRKGVKQTFYLLLVLSAVMMILLHVFRKYLFGMFIDPGVAENRRSLEIGMQYLTNCAVLLWSLYIGQLFRYTLQGAGKTVPMFVTGFVGFAARVFIAWIVAQRSDADLLLFDEPLSWVAEMIFLMIPCMILLKKIKEKEEERAL
ncbi:MAG: MATE family efflux transporter [Anaerovoracaceae bacterium]